MNGWISVKKELPKDDQSVLCCRLGQSYSLPILAYYDEDDKEFITLFTLQDIPVKCDYWMPIPSPPKAEDA